jgi:hypothetical protein
MLFIVVFLLLTGVHWVMDWVQKSFMLVWRYHQLLSKFLANDHLPRVSRESANNKGEYEVEPGTVQDLAFTLRFRKNRENIN